MKLQKFPILAAAFSAALWGLPTQLWAHGGGGHGGGFGGGRGGWHHSGFHGEFRRGFNRNAGVTFIGGGITYPYAYPYAYGGDANPYSTGYNPYGALPAVASASPELMAPPVAEGPNGGLVPVAGDLIGNVQRALKYKGFYQGPIDGVSGAPLRAAIRSYDTCVGLPPTGMIDARLLISLGIM